MKALVLSIVLMAVADRVLEDGAATEATLTLIERLAKGTERDVSESVYRR